MYVLTESLINKLSTMLEASVDPSTIPSAVPPVPTSPPVSSGGMSNFWQQTFGLSSSGSQTTEPTTQDQPQGTNVNVTSLVGKVNKQDTDFGKLAGVIIDNIEGGYYNPSEHHLGDSRYANSGETMFGQDRKAGAQPNNPDWVKFWQTVDQAKQSDQQSWKTYNFKGGQWAQDLKNQCAKLQLQQYTKGMSRLSPEERQIIESDGRLKLLFVDATWNGMGFFNKFADKFDQDYKSGIHDPEVLLKNQITMRTGNNSSLIAQRGGTLQKLVA